MSRWILIRHGQTAGNLQRRYVGARTDEPLTPEAAEWLRAHRTDYPPVPRVFVSPMLRCRQTAELLYPQAEQIVVPDFRECDFGAFENHNYAELNGRADYQAWIDSGGELPFPGGESRASFAERCVQAFTALPPQETDCAIVAHGGTIMAIMERFARPAAGYFDYQARNGCGYVLDADGSYRPLAPESE